MPHLLTFPFLQVTDPTQPPPTYLELKRREAQDYYKKEQQWIKDNEEEFKRLIEQDKAQMMAEAASGGTLLSVLSGGGFKPPTPAGDPAQAGQPGGQDAAPSAGAPSPGAISAK